MSDPVSPANARTLARWGAAYFVASTALLVWPAYGWWGNRVDPRVFGLPWSLASILIVIASNTIVLAVLYRLRAVDPGDDSEVQP